MDMRIRTNATKRRGRRGAALIVALAILAIIMAIAVAFFSTTRLELSVSTNVANSARADMTANAALSIAAAFLNHDLLIHSTYTSLDFAAFTYFNGAWAAGKDWAFPTVGNLSWQEQIALDPTSDPVGTPVVDMDAIRAAGLEESPNRDYFYNETGYLMYVPRYQDADPADYSDNFVINQSIEFPKQTIHRWADVDNDEDGWRDSVWIPIPADTIVGNKDLDGDNIVTYDYNPEGFTGTGFTLSSLDLAGDHIDNNLNNGLSGATSQNINNNVDPDGFPIDDNLDTLANDDRDGIDEVGEVAIFLYRGHADNRDNDADGEIDEVDEDFIDGNADGIWQFGEARIVFLTAPVGLDASVNDWDDDSSSSNYLQVFNYPVIDFRQAIDATRFGPFEIRVDRIDNDYDFILNNYDIRVFDTTDPEFSGWANEQQIIADIYERYPETRGMQRIATQYLVNSDEIVFAMSEPQTELVGRAAVLVRDTASQVHLNAMGAYRDLHDTPRERDVFDLSRNPGDIVRAVNEGIGPHEYVSSLLHSVGEANGRALWQNLLGAPNGLPTTPFGRVADLSESSNVAVSGDPGLTVDNFLLDTSRPGYGGVDDNGNLLHLAINGIDDDGDGFIDEGLNPAYPELIGLAQFEGIDEPGEYRHYQPMRNQLAERDGVDNDNDGNIDEFGEMGDRVLRDESEAGSAIYEIAEVSSGAGDISLSLFNRDNKGFTTIHSSDKGTIGVQRYASTSTLGDVVPVPPDARGATALKLDYNYAPAEVIARTLKQTYGYEPTYFTRTEKRPNSGAADLIAGRIAKGWRTQGVNFFGTPIGGGVFEADGALQANQLAVNIRDFRDADHAQSRITTSEEDDWWNQTLGTGEPRAINYTQAGTESIRINELMVRPVRRVEAEMLVAGSAILAQSANAAAEGTNFDPNLFSVYLAAGVPDFNMGLELIPDQANLGNLMWDLPWDRFATQTISIDIDNDPLLRPDRADMSFGGSSALVMDTTNATVTDATFGANFPNLALFTFRPGPGLPPGRYYMTVNMQQDARVPNSSTVAPAGIVDPSRVNANQVRFLTKYVSNTGAAFATVGGNPISTGTSVGASSILADLRGGPITTGSAEVKGSGSVIVGGPDNGWMFLATDAQQGAPIVSGYLQDEAFTVQIPPYDADEDFRLEVAIWVDSSVSAGIDFALNFFDFSQEPDHEWIEIVNIADNSSAITEADALDNTAAAEAEAEAVDLSGWELEVGTGGDDPIVFRIPDNTLIEPGGKLILAIGDNDATAIPLSALDPFLGYVGELGHIPVRFANDFQRNGIGMVSTNLAQTTPPSIPLIDPTVESQSPADTVDNDGDGLIDEFWNPVDPRFVGGAESPFFFTGDFDPVDVNGNGIDDGEELAAGLVLPADYVDNDGVTVSYFASTTNPATNAGDRIIFLTTSDSNLSLNNSLTGPNSISDRVLNGGFLPNYPERDGIDNDGDSSVLSSDGVDNDGDGVIDEAAETDTTINGLDDDGDTLFDEPDEVFAGDTSGVIPYGNNNGIRDLAEGVDEGRWYVRPDSSSESFADDYERPGSFMIRRTDLFADGIPMAADYVVQDGLTGPAEVISQPTLVDASAEWKTHTEKRWYPGDAVRVTLYVGPRTTGEIADQVTYTEQDVINRSIHDGIDCPYERLIDIDLDGNADIGGPFAAALRPDALTMWPEDHMALDFYRSLERKHPLYAGDMVGTSNRWEATDGAYDDWDSGRMAQQLTGSRWPDEDLDGFADPITTGTPLMDDAIRMIAHQFSASPLRQNYWQRQVEDHGFSLRDIDTAAIDANVGDVTTFNGAFSDLFGIGSGAYDPAVDAASFPSPDPAALFSTTLTAQELEAIAPYRSERRFTLNRLAYRYGAADTDPIVIYHAARIRNKSLVSPGDLVTMPMMMLNRTVFDTATLVDTGPAFDGVAGVLLGETSPSSRYLPFENPDPSGVLAGNPNIGGRRANDLSAASDTGATNSVSLSVGLADVYTIYPDANPTALHWTDAGATRPRAWSPVFLFPITSSNVTLKDDALGIPNDVTETASTGGLDLITRQFNTAPGHIVPQIRTITPAYFLGEMPDITGQFDGPTNLASSGFYEVGDIRDPLRGDHYALRWPLHDRAVMYVTANVQDFVGSDYSREPVAGANNDIFDIPNRRPAESLFMWDGSDGVENGRYDMYVITTEPLDGFLNSPLLTAMGEDIINSTDNESRLAYGIDVEAFTDRNGDRRVWGWNTTGSPVLNDYPQPQTVAQNENLNRGQFEPGVPSESMGQLQGLIPGVDGVVYYGPVDVENNTLAVFLRNWAEGGKLNRVSRVVLTPRRKERGRININTASTDLGDIDASNSFNPLRGVPGALANVGPAAIPGTVVFVDPSLSSAVLPLTSSDTLPGGSFATRASAVADRIILGRNNSEWVDGRYYLHPSNLIAYGHESNGGYNSDWNTGILATDALLAGIPGLNTVSSPYFNSITEALGREFGGFVVDNNMGTFTESVIRYGRMANLITTRSDTFEIIITAQSGYISSVDSNNDGRIDYKSDFVSTGEKKIRVVYER